MAATYTVNLNLHAGAGFNQKFYLTNPDKSPTNIKGYKFWAKMAKHGTSMIATQSTRDNPKYNYISFSVVITNGKEGEYTLTMAGKRTATISEGKYVYSVVAQDLNGNQNEIQNGLVFVERAFASPDSETIFDGGGAFMDEANAVILDGGNSSSY